jgi:serine/threonine-protein kinase RsbW
MSTADEQLADTIELRVPADGAYVSLVRTVTAALAARCELTLDDMEDLRIAVDEACSLLLPHAAGTSSLHARYSLKPGCLEITAQVHTAGPTEIDRKGFAWTLLQALATSVTVSNDGRLAIELVKQREAHAT